MSSGQGQGLFGATTAADGNRQLTDQVAFGREWAGVLADVPLFAGLSKRHLRRVARMAQKASYPEHTVIVTPRRGADAFYVILDGRAKVSTVTGDRIELGPGRFFGEMALLDDSPRTATVTAATDLLVMRISRQHFREMVESEPKIAYAIMGVLAARVRRVETDAQA
jgi:CRP-like cAMP-binding protein